MSSDSVACLQVECKQMELAVGTLAARCHLGIDYRRMKITVKSLPALLLGCTSTPRWLLERCCSTTSLQEGNGEVSPAHQAKVSLCVGLSDCQESDALTGAGVPCHTVGVYRHCPSLFHSLKAPWYWHPHVLCCSHTRKLEQKSGRVLVQAHTDMWEEKTQILYDLMQHYMNDTHQRNNGYDAYLQNPEFAEQASSLWEKLEAKHLSGQKSASSASNESIFLFKGNQLYSENMDNI